jgi:hypothetical protein
MARVQVSPLGRATDRVKQPAFSRHFTQSDSSVE